MTVAVDDYSEAFRNLINSKTARPGPIQELLRLNKESDWRFICASMDIVGDAEGAIDNFLRFGLDGPTRYKDPGENYLRLYGVLSATYLQQRAVEELYRLMNVPNPQDARDRINGLEIRRIRHMLASHSVDYRNPTTNEIEAYAPTAMSMNGFSCDIASLTLDPPEKVELKPMLNAHSSLLVELLDQIYEKTYRTLFKGQEKRLAEHKEKLADLRIGGKTLRVGEHEIVIDGTDRGL